MNIVRVFSERILDKNMIRTASTLASRSARAVVRSGILHPAATGRSVCSSGATRPALRLYSSSSSSSSTPRRGLGQIPLAAVALIGGGLVLTAAGLWKFYTSGVNAFPEGIRDDLRKALYYQNYGNDQEKAVGYYRSALSAAMQHPDLRMDGPEVTGIMIQLGTMLQDMGRTHEAIDVLVMAFECLVHGQTMGMSNDSFKVDHRDGSKDNNSSSNHGGVGHDKGEDQSHTTTEQLGYQQEKMGQHHGPRMMDGPTRLKTVGIAQKLGDLYHSIRKDEQAERYYLWSVEQLLKNHEGMEGRVGGGISDEERLQNARDQENVRQQFQFDNLPKWMTKTDLGASLEALGGFYASKGIYSNALPLYMRALSLVEADSCHAAVLMCNISDTFAGLGNVEDAMGWAERGLKVGTRNSGQECDEGCGVLLYNLGMLYEEQMKGNMLKAEEYYKQSKQHGLRTGFDQCIVESNKALKRLKET
ncbi:hypothetical protein BGX34_004641 [Mortierella sp. NVP85]|nr:hypothetical protein BGX34_004641 [Mortierella sp. NVP85]